MSFLFCIKQSKDIDNFKEDFHIAVIETTEQDNDSYITFYNKDLKKIGSQNIKMGSMGSYFDLPRIYGSNMYVIPKGIGSEKDLTVIMEYNLETGKYKTYNIGQPGMNSFAVNDNAIYTVNTLNYNSIISRYDIASGNLRTITIEQVYIGRLDLYDETLFAFGDIKEDDGLKSYLYLIDTKNFKMIDTIDISKCGTSQNYSTKIGDYIYFTSQTDTYDQGSDTLTKFNIKDKMISIIKLQELYPFQILNYRDKLIISHFNLVQAQGNIITMFDPITNEQKVLNLENNLAQILIKDDKLYSMDGDFLYVYSISDKDFKLLNRIDIHTMKKSSKYFYLAGFFTKGS